MVLPGMDCAWAEHPSAEASSAVASLIIGVPPSSAVNSLALANVPGLTGRSAGLVRQVLISGKIHRDGRAADCVPGGDPALDRPGVEALTPQLGDGFAADLKSADAIHRDWPVARQVLDPARQGPWRVHLGAWQHVRAPWQVQNGKAHHHTPPTATP